MAEKTSYQNLREMVWDTGICSGCGACTAVCPADALYFCVEPGILHPVSSGYCKQESDNVPCGACFAVCPRGKERGDEAATDLLGTCLRITGAHATGPVPRRQNGGAVTAILRSALEEGIIDGVITVGEDRFSHRPFSLLVTVSGDLVSHAGTRYNWSVPVLQSLKTAVIDKKLSRLAVIGTPCVASAARIMKNSENDLVKPFGNAIRLIIGLFCTETFDYGILMKEILSGKGYDLTKIDRLNVKGRLEITLLDGTSSTVSLEDVDSAVRSGCRVCRDFSGLDADISAGSVGTPDQVTTLIIRTPAGESFVERAIHVGMLAIDEPVDRSRIENLSRAKLYR